METGAAIIALWKQVFAVSVVLYPLSLFVGSKSALLFPYTAF
jgi:hypothetical protein